MTHKRIALTAFISQALRILSGPITIILIARTLSSEEMSFYYSFFNVIALQQILEMGVGFVIKQYISHDYRVDEMNEWQTDSLEKIKSYFIFSCVWFSLISIFICVCIGLFGNWFFSSYQGNIIWNGPWWAIVFATAISTLATPIQFLLEGCQQQLKLYKGRVVYGVSSAISLCVSLYYGAGLYSIAISVVISNVFFYGYIYKQSYKLVYRLLCISSYTSVVKILIEIWPMLSKISVTWIMGFFFWNSFNLIAFKLLPIELAGRFGFTLSLARAGLSIAESLVSSQTTIYSNYISMGKSAIAKSKFEQLAYLSFFILLVGYALYVVGKLYLPTFFLFDKALDIKLVMWIFCYFVLLLPVLLQANYCRCFKKEPYFHLSMFVNIQVPVVFLLICYFIRQPLFLYLLPFSLLSLMWSLFIYRNNAID